MTDHAVRKVEVTDPVAAGRRHDYADAFEVELERPDREPPESWVLAGLRDAPPVVKWIVARLGIGKNAAPGTVQGWAVVESGPSVVHLTQSLPMLRVAMVGRNVGPSRRTLTTVLDYRRPVLARVVWSLIRGAHRRTARRVITARSATTEAGSAR